MHHPGSRSVLENNSACRAGDLPVGRTRMKHRSFSAREALERLREGNRRFVSGVRNGGIAASETRRYELAAGQHPFAIILGCSDSRVPAEIVFVLDQGLGDLFVIRVAGNIVASSEIGSVEFAAERFGTLLVVVLGHSRCGAVLATLEELMQPRENQSRNLRSIVDRIRPSVEALLATELRHDSEALVRHAIRTNVRVSSHELRHGSEVLEHAIQRAGLVVVGADPLWRPVSLSSSTACLKPIESDSTPRCGCPVFSCRLLHRSARH